MEILEGFRGQFCLAGGRQFPPVAGVKGLLIPPYGDHFSPQFQK